MFKNFINPILLIIIFTSCSTNKMQEFTADACPATLSKVREQCGCSPLEERAYNALHQTKLPEDVKLSAEECINAGFGLSNEGALQAKAGFTSCLDKKNTLDNDYKKSLEKIVDKAINSITLNENEIWSECRRSIKTSRKADYGVAKVDVSTGKILSTTFDEDEFQFVSMNMPKVDTENVTIIFKLKKKATVVEANGSQLFGIKVNDTPIYKDNWYEYTGNYNGGYNFDEKAGSFIDTITFKAYFSEN